MGLVVVTVPGDKRARALLAAAARVGIEPVCVSWLSAIEDPARVGLAGRPGDYLRVDSPGSDPATWWALAQRGGLEAFVPPGEWRPGRAWFAGISEVLGAIERGAEHLIATHPHALTMTDKAVCQERLEAAGVPVPPTIDSVGWKPTATATEPVAGGFQPTELREWLGALGWGAVFVKPRWGSSGAGVLAWRRGAGRSEGRETLTTTTSLREGRMVNDKRLHTYLEKEDIDRLLGAVLSDGAVVQRWVPKAVRGGPFDLRVLIIDGRVAQRIGRVGRGTITNLHVDAARAEPEALLSPWPGASQRVDDACLAAAACFPGHRCLGVDVMIDAKGQPYVLECNAWGDYLPGLTIDGQDTYDLQLRGLFA